MNKFQQNLTASNKELKGKRGELSAKQAASGHQKILQAANSTVDEIELEILDHTDLSRINAHDLAGSAVPKDWAETLQSLNIKLLDAKVKLKIAQATQAEWFDDDKSTK